MQQITGFLDFQHIDVLDDGVSRQFLKSPAQMTGGNIESGGDLVNAGQGEEILMDIGNQRRNLIIFLGTGIKHSAFWGGWRIKLDIFL